MVAESEVPLGTAEPVLFPGAPVVPKGTQCLDHPILPALKRWAIFSDKDAKYDPITPRVSNWATTNAQLARSGKLAPARFLELNRRVIDFAAIDLFVFLGDVAPGSQPQSHAVA